MAKAGLKSAEDEARASGDRSGKNYSEGFSTAAGTGMKALAPALIPLTAAATAGIAGIGVSLGGTLGPLAVFGAMVKTTLTNSTTLTAGLTKQWTTLSEKIAAPVLVPWVDVLSRALTHLQPLVQPIADQFKSWGQALNQYFASSRGSAEITKLATELGKFAGQQLQQIVRFFIDAGKGVATLGGYLSGHNVDFDSFGKNLDKWGTAFANWSQSKSARDDVTSLLRYLHDNGGTISSILGDLATDLPKMFTGLSSAGSAELKAISGFLGFINGLPPSVSKPLFDIAGALLILNKMGVVKVGVSVTGAVTGALAKTAFGAALMSGAAAFILPVTLSVAAIIGLDQIKDKTGGGKLLAPTPADLGFDGRWVKDIQGWWDKALTPVTDNKQWALVAPTSSALGFNGSWVKNITHWWDLASSGTGSIIASMTHSVLGQLDDQRHQIAVVFDGVRHDILADFDGAGNWLVGHGKDILNGLRSGATTAWDSAYSWLRGLPGKISGVFSGSGNWLVGHGKDLLNGLKNGASSAFSSALSWLRGLPGKISGVFNGSRNWLNQHGKDILYGLWDGLEAVWGKVTSWISGLAGWIKNHKGPVSFDRQLLVENGKALMSGLHIGLLHGFKDGPMGFVSGLGGTIAGMLSTSSSSVFKKFGSKAVGAAKSAWDDLFGGGGTVNYKPGAGVSQWKGLVDQALAMLGLPKDLDSNVLYQMQTESGGNPNAVNNWDINAKNGTPSKGLMQVIQPTFDTYHVAGTSNNLLNPLANIAAAINYAKHVYGPSLANQYGGIGSGHGYAAGGATANGWATVGERGRELVKLPGGATVYPAGATAAMAAGGASASLVQLEISSGGQGAFEQFMLTSIRNWVRVKGGGDVQRAFGKN